jgi:hypothetical protein
MKWQHLNIGLLTFVIAAFRAYFWILHLRIFVIACWDVLHDLGVYKDTAFATFQIYPGLKLLI